MTLQKAGVSGFNGDTGAGLTQDSSQTQHMDRSQHLVKVPYSVEIQDSIKGPESDKTPVDEAQYSVCAEDSNKIEYSIQGQNAISKNIRCLLLITSPNLVAKRMPHLKIVKPKGRKQITSSKLNRHSAYGLVPLSLAIKRQKNRRKILRSKSKFNLKVSSQKSKKTPASWVFQITICPVCASKRSKLGCKYNTKKKELHQGKSLSDKALHIIYVSKFVFPYIKYSRRKLVKVLPGLTGCRHFLPKQNKLLAAEKVSYAGAAEKRGSLGNTEHVKQHGRDHKGLKHLSPKTSPQVQRSFMVDTYQLKSPYSLLIEINWKNKESFKDPTTQAKETGTAQFYAPNCKKTTDLNIPKPETPLEEAISEHLQKFVFSPNMELNRGMKTLEGLKSTENAHLPLSNEEELPPSTLEMQGGFLEGNIQKQKDILEVVLEFSDVSSLISLGTKKHKGSEQLAGVKIQESTGDRILKDKRPIIVTVTAYDSLSESEELECDIRVKIKNMQDKIISDALHNATDTTISEPPDTEMHRGLKAKPDTIEIMGFSHSATKQGKLSNEKKISNAKYSEKRCIFKKPQEHDRGEEEQVLQEEVTQLAQDFRVSLQLKQEPKYVKFETGQSTSGSRKTQNKEQAVQPPTPSTQRISGPSPCPTMDPFQVKKVKQSTDRPTVRETADLKSPLTEAENSAAGEVFTETPECGVPFGESPGKTLGDHIAEEREYLKRVLPEVVLRSFMIHMLPLLYFKRQKIIKKLPGTKSTLDPRCINMKVKKPAISLVPYNRYGIPGRRKRLRGNVKILTQQMLLNKIVADVLLNVICHQPHIRTHSRLNTENQDNTKLKQEKSQAGKEEKCSDSISKESDSGNIPEVSKLQDEVRGNKEAPPKAVLCGSCTIRLDARPEEELKTLEEMHQPITSAGTIMQSICSFRLDPFHENMKKSITTQTDLKGTADSEVLSSTSEKSLIGEPLNQTRGSSVPDQGSDTREMRCCFAETKAELPEGLPAAFPETSNCHMPILTHSKLKRKSVRFSPIECTMKPKSEHVRAMKPSISELSNTTGHQEKLECNFKNKFEKIDQANGMVYEFLNNLYSPMYSRLQVKRNSFCHAQLKQQKLTDEERPWYVDFFDKSNAFCNREEKVQNGGEVEQRTSLEAAPQRTHYWDDACQGMETHPDTPDPKLGCLTQELQHQTCFKQTALQIGLQMGPREAEELQETNQTENDRAPLSLKILPPKAGNSPLDKCLNTTTECGLPSSRNSKKQLDSYFMENNSELQKHLQVISLKSSDSVEKPERCSRFSPPKSGEAKIDEIFSARKCAVPLDANHQNELIDGIEKKETVTFDCSTSAFTTSKRKKNIKQYSDTKMLVNPKSRILKAKKPSISYILNIKGSASPNHRRKLGCNLTTKMKKVDEGEKMADKMYSFMTITPDINMHSKIEREKDMLGEKQLSSKQVKQAISLHEGDITSDDTEPTNSRQFESNFNVTMEESIPVADIMLNVISSAMPLSLDINVNNRIKSETDMPGEMRFSHELQQQEQSPDGKRACVHFSDKRGSAASSMKKAKVQGGEAAPWTTQHFSFNAHKTKEPHFVSSDLELKISARTKIPKSLSTTQELQRRTLKIDIEMYSTLKAETVQQRVKLHNPTYLQLEESLCYREAQKANFTDTQNRSNCTMKMNVQQNKEEVGVKTINLMFPKRQEKKIQGRRDEPGVLLARSSISLPSLPLLKLDKEIQRITNAVGIVHTGPISGEIMKDVQNKKPYLPQKEERDAEKTVPMSVMIHTADTSLKSKKSAFSYMPHRTELHVNIERQGENKHEGQGKPPGTVLRKVYVSKPPTNLKLDKDTQVDEEELGIKRPPLFSEMVSALSDTEKTEDTETIGDVRKRIQDLLQKEKDREQNKVKDLLEMKGFSLLQLQPPESSGAGNLKHAGSKRISSCITIIKANQHGPYKDSKERVKIEGGKGRILPKIRTLRVETSPLTQLFSTKRLPLNIKDQVKDVQKDKGKPETVQRRACAPLPSAAHLNRGTKTNEKEDTLGTTQSSFPPLKIQYSSNSGEKTFTKSVEGYTLEEKDRLKISTEDKMLPIYMDLKAKKLPLPHILNTKELLCKIKEQKRIIFQESSDSKEGVYVETILPDILGSPQEGKQCMPQNKEEAGVEMTNLMLPTHQEKKMPGSNEYDFNRPKKIALQNADNSEIFTGSLSISLMSPSQTEETVESETNLDREERICLSKFQKKPPNATDIVKRNNLSIVEKRGQNFTNAAPEDSQPFMVDQQQMQELSSVISEENYGTEINKKNLTPQTEERVVLGHGISRITKEPDLITIKQEEKAPEPIVTPTECPCMSEDPKENVETHLKSTLSINISSPGVEEPQHETQPIDTIVFLSLEGIDTIKINLNHEHQNDSPPMGCMKTLTVNVSTGSKELITKLKSISELENGTSPVTSANKMPLSQILQNYSVEEKDKLLMHFSVKTLEVQMKAFPRTVRESYAMADTQDRRKPLSKCIHSGVKVPKEENRILLFFEEKSLHQIELDLQYKYLRFLQGLSVESMFPKPNILPEHNRKLNSVAMCKKVDNSGESGSLSIERDLLEQHISLKKQSPHKNSSLIRRFLEPTHVCASDPELHRTAQKDTTVLSVLRSHVTTGKKKHHVWFQETDTHESFDFKTKEHAPGLVDYHSIQTSQDFPECQTDIQSSANLEERSALKVHESEESMFLEDNPYLNQESESILLKLQKGIPLEKVYKMKQIKTDLKPFHSDKSGSHHIRCRKPSTVTPPSCESCKSRKYRSSSKIQSPDCVCHNSLNTVEVPFVSSSVPFSEEKLSCTTKNRTSYSLAPLTESNIKLHLAKTQDIPHRHPESKERKKAKHDLFTKNFVWDCDPSYTQCKKKCRRKKALCDYESEKADFPSKHKSASKLHQEDISFHSERKQNQPFFYACVPADSVESIPQTICWTIPQTSLRRQNIRVPIVAKISSSFNMSSSRKLLGSFL
ncbi:LOW QUALITY PROTEIN: leucine-rich repeat transmembrane protein CCDC168 [Rhynchonycteris naso]